MASQQRPNILLIMTDQHRLSALGCYGGDVCRTPNLDALAADGLRFETAYTVCPVCTPARASVITGQWPHTHGMCCNVYDLGNSVHELVDAPDLLSRQLYGAGYLCGFSGKWHLGTDHPGRYGHAAPCLPNNVGFTGQNFPGHGGGGFRYPEYRQYLAAHGYRHRVTDLHKRPVQVWPYGVLEGPVESTVDYFLAQNSIDMMRQAASDRQPFFVWHNFWGPHAPYYAPREFYELYEHLEIPEWPNYRWPAREVDGPHEVKIHPLAEQLGWEDWAEAVRHYYASASLIDSQIGRMLAYLDASGLRENTIVLMTADHGETLGSHGGLTDKGHHHFEEIQRIPFIAWLPDHFMAGSSRQRGTGVEEWASLIDLYPTLLAAAGVSLPRPVPGRSLLPVLRGEPEKRRDLAFVEFHGVNGIGASLVTVRSGDWKYGWNPGNRDELYDLANDPFEMRNLAREPGLGAVTTEMRALIDAWMVETAYPGINMYRQSRMGINPWVA